MKYMNTLQAARIPQMAMPLVTMRVPIVPPTARIRPGRASDVRNFRTRERCEDNATRLLVNAFGRLVANLPERPLCRQPVCLDSSRGELSGREREGNRDTSSDNASRGWRFIRFSEGLSKSCAGVDEGRAASRVALHNHNPGCHFQIRRFQPLADLIFATLYPPSVDASMSTSGLTKRIERVPDGRIGIRDALSPVCRVLVASRTTEALGHETSDCWPRRWSIEASGKGREEGRKLRGGRDGFLTPTPSLQC
jgi:hypothetical protein